MDRHLDVWFIVVAAAAVAAVWVQVCFSLALFGIGRLSTKLKEIRARSSLSSLALRDLVTTAHETLENINRVAKNTAGLTERSKPVVNGAAGVSLRQVPRADQVLGDMLTRVERIGEIPVLSAALRTAPTVLFQHPKNSKGCDRLSASLLSRSVLLPALILTGLFPIRVDALQAPQQVVYEGAKVSFVDLVVRPGTDAEALRPLILQKADEPYSNEKVQGSVRALQLSGRFSKVDVQVTPEATGLRLAFVIQPAYYLGMIYFPGAAKVFGYPRLLQVVNYPAQEPYEPSRVKDADAALLHFFADNGYFQARVETETRVDDPHGLVDVIFHVSLSRRAKLGRVEIAGVSSKEADRLRQTLRSWRARLKGALVASGQPYDPERLRAATAFARASLARENRLASQVRLQPARYNPSTHRADISFQVELGPTIAVQVVGARVSKRTLRKLVPIYEENSFDQDLVEEGERNLVSYFQAKGFFDVKVNADVEDDPSDISLVYRIDKGRRHRLLQVTLRGNHHFDENDLMDQVVVQRGRFLSRGKFSQDLVKRSANNLTAFYRDAGFEDVKVQPEVVDREPKVYVTFKIAEGDQTLVDSLRVDGNKTQAVAALAPDGLHLRSAQPYSRTRLNQDRSQIVATYLNLGYANVKFKSSVKPAAGNPHRVAVTYLIDEGPQVRIDQVAYLGGQHTRQSFVRHNTSVESGVPLSQGKFLESESNLYNLGVFDWANVSPRKPITDQQKEEVLVKVHEASRNSLSWGLGFESASRSGSLSSGIVALPGLPTVGLPPSFTIIEKNVISPLGSIEYSRLNLRGRGETGSIATILSRLDQRASFTYSDPQFRGLAWSALWSLSAERTTQNPLFTARLGSGSFQLEKALDAGRTKRLQFRYTFQRTTLTDLLIQRFVLPEDTNVRSSTLSTSFLRDTRDKPLDAHKGVFQTLDFGVSPKAIGSSNNVVRLFGQAAFYREVKPWMVWANNFRLGLIKAFAGSHVPISERFFSGGYDSLRGFPLNGAGPQEPATLCTSATDRTTCTLAITVPEGGRQLFIFNSEGRFPIPLKKGLGGVIFYDGGNVYRAININHFFSCGGGRVQPGCGYSNTVGFGLRYQTPVGPIRIDIGRNLNPVPGLKSTQIFVTLGQSF